MCVWKNEFSGLRQGRWSEVSWRLCLDTGVVFEVSGSLSNLISKFLLLQVLLNLGKSSSDFDSASQTAKGFFLTKRKLWQRHFLQSARHYFCRRFILSTFSVRTLRYFEKYGEISQPLGTCIKLMPPAPTLTTRRYPNVCSLRLNDGMKQF